MCLSSFQTLRAGDPRFTVVRVDTSRENLQVFLSDESGHAFKRFDRLAPWLRARKKRLLFAMNAGMYHPDFSPVGLLVRDGIQLSPLNLGSGFGNFFLKPNGVFVVSRSGPQVIESSEYVKIKAGVRLATQSGPLLVHRGVINRAFRAASSSRLIRNGVGVSRGKAFFVISEQPINFYELALFFRDNLQCPNALYFDGVVSSLYSAALGRRDLKTDLGPIIGVIK